MECRLSFLEPLQVAAGDPKTAIIVCGMHRCGTSALTRVISLLGAALPQELVQPGPGNEAGHWEPAAAVRLNDDMLASAGTHATALWDGSTDWFSSQTAQTFVAEAKRIITRDYSGKALFVLKDPRISLVLPVWNAALDELGVARHTIICFRQPLEVAQSLATRQTLIFPHEAWDLDRGRLLWLRYILAAERHSRQSSRTFCAYPDLLHDWRRTMQGIAAMLALVWPRWSVSAEREVDQFLIPQLRHHHVTAAALRGGPWEELIIPVYEALVNSSSGVPVELFDAVAADLRKAVQILGGHIAEFEVINARLGCAAKVAESQAATALAQAEEAERSAQAAEFERAMSRQLLDELRSEVAALRERAAGAESEMVFWRDRYEGLRLRLINVLRRYGVPGLARLVPAPVRRFIRDLLLRPRS